jgi:hypothetical protein
MISKFNAKISKLQGFFSPITIFQGKIKNFQIFSSFQMFPQKMIRKQIFYFKILGKKELFPKFIFSNLKIYR